MCTKNLGSCKLTRNMGMATAAATTTTVTDHIKMPPHYRQGNETQVGMHHNVFLPQLAALYRMWLGVELAL